MELVVAVWGMILGQNGAHIGGMFFFWRNFTFEGESLDVGKGSQLFLKF